MPKIRIVHNEPTNKQSVQVKVRTRDKDGRYGEPQRHLLRPGETMFVNVRAHQDVVLAPARSNRA